MRLGLLLLIGLPGCGKTTLAKTLITNFQQCNDNKYKFIHVCYDELIPNQNFNREFQWKAARSAVVQKVEKLVTAIKNKSGHLCPPEFLSQLDNFGSWDCNIVLILDDNMYFKSMRYSFFQMAKKHCLSFCQVYVSCSLEWALTNNSLRESNFIIPPHVIENIHNRMEPPDIGNNWERYSVKLSAFCNSSEICSKLFPMLNESLVNFVHVRDDDSEAKELSKLQCKRSLLHQTDIALRKIIGLKIKKYINENLKGDLKEYGAALNLRKSEILSDIKTGNIHLPDEVLEEINEDVTENFQLINLLGSYL